MSQNTKQEVLAKLRRQYSRAGLAYKRQLLDQAIALLGYHRKAAIRALRAGPRHAAPWACSWAGRANMNRQNFYRS